MVDNTVHLQFIISKPLSKEPLFTKDAKDKHFSLIPVSPFLRLLLLLVWKPLPTHWKRPWWWERLKAEGKQGNREWDGWVASPIQWIWNWANSRRWWGTERPGMLRSMGVTESQTWLDDWTTKTTTKQGVALRAMAITNAVELWCPHSSRFCSFHM